MTHYKPNFNNLAVRRRALLVIEFVDKFLRPNKPQWLSSKWIHHPNNFGSNRNQLSLYLKDLVLICVNEKYRVGIKEDKSDSKCKEYILSERGMRYLRGELGLATKIDLFDIENENSLIKTNKHTNYPYCCVNLHPTFQKHLDEFQTGEFRTKELSLREFHAIQNLPSAVKDSNFALVGYQYNSDIVCAAPTLLYQHAKQCGLNKPLLAIEYYINNRTQVRNRICDLLEVTTPKDRQAVKRVLSGLFNGMYLTCKADSDIVALLDKRYILIERLKRDLFIQRLRKEIREMWTFIKANYRGSKGTTGRLTPKEKSEIYRGLEKSVRDIVKRYMNRNNIMMFPEHDGWRTNKMYDLNELRVLIKNQTGFVIEIDWEVTGNDDY